jgi:acyl CoA:acetate/3-ketoacid CoA transferase beta subunit
MAGPKTKWRHARARKTAHVNLGIGISTLVANHVSTDIRSVAVCSMLGIGL